MSSSIFSKPALYPGFFEQPLFYLPCADSGDKSIAQQAGEFHLDLQAAEQGDLDAQLRVSDCYFDGRGTVQNDNEGCRWYRIAINNRSAWHAGGGKYRSYTNSYHWYVHLASTKGDVNCMFMAARMHDMGLTLGIIDPSQYLAIKCYKRAADKGYHKAIKTLEEKQLMEIESIMSSQFTM